MVFAKRKQMYANHVMLLYFMECTRGDFSPEPKYVTTEADMEKMPSGSIILWDSYYDFMKRNIVGIIQIRFNHYKPIKRKK